MIETEDFLAHFGVKGMRWGVVNDEQISDTESPKHQIVKGNTAIPKTIKSVTSEQTTRRETRAMAKEAKAAKLNVKINALKKQNYNSIKVADLKDARKTALDDAQRIRDGKLTRTQKNLVVGASIAVGIMAAYGVYKFHDSGEMGQAIIKGREFITGQKFAWKTNANLARKNMSPNELMRDVVSKINPNYGAYGTKMNCRRATFAYEMRRRGYDVKATLSSSAVGQSQLGVVNAIDPQSSLPTRGFKVFKDEVLADYYKDKHIPYASPIQAAKKFGLGRNQIPLLPTDSGAAYLSRVIKPKSQSIFDTLSKQPNGSRGELSVMWTMGGAHSMAYEVIKGKAHIFDTQSGEHFGTPQAFYKLAETIQHAGFTRLDNVQLNEDFLQRWVTNV